MRLLQAIESALDGVQDKAGITNFDVYVAEFKQKKHHTMQQKVQEVAEVIEADLADDERKWFFVSSAVKKWSLKDEATAERVREALSAPDPGLAMKARYHALDAMGSAGEGLLPDEIMSEITLKENAPKLWLELFLSAYRNGNPPTITEQVSMLVAGQSPAMSWKSLRSLLPELRKAYGSIEQFRKEIKAIAECIDSVVARKSLLTSAEKRVGGGLDQAYTKKSRKANVRRQFAISNRAIQNDIRFSQKRVSPNGVVAFA